MKLIQEVQTIAPATLVKVIDGCAGSRNATNLIGVVVNKPEFFDESYNYEGQLPENIAVLIYVDGVLWGLPKDCVLEVIPFPKR